MPLNARLNACVYTVAGAFLFQVDYTTEVRLRDRNRESISYRLINPEDIVNFKNQHVK